MFEFGEFGNAEELPHLIPAMVSILDDRGHTTGPDTARHEKSDRTLWVMKCKLVAATLLNLMWDARLDARLGRLLSILQQKMGGTGILDEMTDDDRGKMERALEVLIGNRSLFSSDSL